MKYSKEECLKKGKELNLKNINEWEKCVNARFSGLYEGIECSHFVELAEKQIKLNWTIDQIKKALNEQDHSGGSYAMVKKMAETFCPSLLPAFDEKVILGVKI